MPRVIEKSNNESVGVAVGSIQASATSTIPNGWLSCDGQVVSRTVYADLFAKISTSYGVGDGSTTFKIPDFRGMFLRGSGTNGVYTTYAGGTVGAYVVEKTKKNGLSASAGTSSISGTAAGDSASGTAESGGGHYHNADSYFSGYIGTGYVAPRDHYAIIVSGQQEAGGSPSTPRTSVSGAHTHTVTVTVPSLSVSGTAAAQTITVGAGDSETKPVSYSILYIIKY